MAESKYYEYTTKNVLGKIGLSTQGYLLFLDQLLCCYL